MTDDELNRAAWMLQLGVPVRLTFLTARNVRAVRTLRRLNPWEPSDRRLNPWEPSKFGAFSEKEVVVTALHAHNLLRNYQQLDGELEAPADGPGE